MQKLVTFLWYDGEAEAAARFYVSLIPNSKLGAIARYGEAAPGPVFRFTEAVSLQVPCDDQAEIDRLWAALTDGGEESQCGWCKDRWGLSWQITPARMPQLIGGDDPAKARRAMEAMFTMKKLDIAALERARDG